MFSTTFRKCACAVAVIIYAIILAMNLAGCSKLATDSANHVFVLASLIFCAVEWREHHDNALLSFMALTLVADVLSGFVATFAAGVVVFFASQIVLSLIIWRSNGKKHGVVLRAALIAAGLAAIIAAGVFSPLYAFGIVYFMWFVANVMQALAAGNALPLRFRVGLVLYVLGDVCLIGNLLFAPAGLLGVILTYGTWMVYLPGVLALALSPKERA